MTILNTDHISPDVAEALQRALAGEEIVLSHQGKPYAKITKVVKVEEQVVPRKKRRAGTMKGLVKYMADDFNAPLDDFKDYMPE